MEKVPELPWGGLDMSLRNEYRNLLAQGGEAPMQRFFEENPWILTGNDYVDPRIVVSKLKLGADFVTDFVYFNPTSGATFLRVIEIEDPHKPIFNKDDSFTREFNNALQQCTDWLLWCQRNREYINNIFRAAPGRAGSQIQMFVARGVLLYGRRAEINSSRRSDRWQSKANAEPFVTIRTYDGLEESVNNLWEFSRKTYSPRCVVYDDGGFKDKS